MHGAVWRFRGLDSAAASPESHVRRCCESEISNRQSQIPNFRFGGGTATPWETQTPNRNGRIVAAEADRVNAEMPTVPTLPLTPCTCRLPSVAGERAQRADSARRERRRGPGAGRYAACSIRLTSILTLAKPPNARFFCPGTPFLGCEGRFGGRMLRWVRQNALVFDRFLRFMCPFLSVFVPF